MPNICYTYTESDQRQRRDLNISSQKWNARFRSCVKMCEGCCMSLLFVLYSMVLKINIHLIFMRSITCCMYEVYNMLYNKYNLSLKPVILWQLINRLVGKYNVFTFLSFFFVCRELALLTNYPDTIGLIMMITNLYVNSHGLLSHYRKLSLWKWKQYKRPWNDLG